MNEKPGFSKKGLLALLISTLIGLVFFYFLVSAFGIWAVIGSIIILMFIFTWMILTAQHHPDDPNKPNK